MPEVLKIDFSKDAKVAALELKLYRGDELRNHGAPCSLIVENRGMINGDFWDSMRAVNDALNSTPDTHPLRLPELRANASVNFNNAGRHVLAGGEKAYIDSIRRPDISMVASKALREMRALNLISDSDYKSGLEKMADFGLPVQESLFRDHRSFKKSGEKKPTAPK
ncbi:MAG: hypothetical protein ACAH83_09280 [Alphaproteobacteria bacterium]